MNNLRVFGLLLSDITLLTFILWLFLELSSSIDVAFTDVHELTQHSSFPPHM